jgi:hypothetical protein
MASTLNVAGTITGVNASLTTADNSDNLTLKSTDADDTKGPCLVLQRDSSSPADGDVTGFIEFKVDNDAGEATSVGEIKLHLSDASDGTEDSQLNIRTMSNGALRNRMSAGATSTVFNNDAVDLDFVVKGDTDANNLVVDASADRVGIGVAAPASKLEISAGVNSGGLLRLDDTDAGNLGGYMQFDSNGTNKANIQNANNAGIHLCVGTGGSVVFTALGYTAANALDDYEEGTFTPTIASGGFTNNSNTGEYTKVGNIVHIRMGFVCNSNASTSDVGGLPFPVTGSTAYSSFYPAIFMGDNATNAPITPNFKIGTSNVSFKQSNGTAAHNINTTISTYRIVGFYYTTS